MSVSWITYKDKKILYSDFRGMKTPDMIKQLEDEAKQILNAPSRVLYLGNFEGTVIENDFMKKANEFGKQIELKNEKSAVVGIKGMKAVLLSTYNLFTGGKMKQFGTEDEAKEYLIKN